MANKHCRKFNNHEDYISALTDGELIKHNISYCKTEKDAHYDNDINNYYSSQYFTIKALDDGNVYFKYQEWSPVSTQRYIEYSKDNGNTWNRTTNVDNQEIIMSIPLLTGETALVRGDNDTFASYFEGDDDCFNSFFYSDIEFNVYGNIMSLLYNDDFLNEYEISEFAFRNLFFDIYNGYWTGDDLNQCFLVNAKDLILPATTLANYCYDSMFSGCTSLTTAPELLPATTLANYCYNYMFNGCTSLTEAPELPATTLAQNCYNYMFNGCTSLTEAPELPATTLAQNCYNYMFNECTSLTTAPELPATTLANYCYDSMFYYCTSLTTAPELPATTLVQGCYSNMFNGCTSLTTAPELPATTLAYYCYGHMFANTNVLPDCSNIDFTSQTIINSGGLNGLFARTKVTDNDLRNILPINPTTNNYYLPVNTLADNCYYQMFHYCTSLTTAPELPATTLAQNCYENMFSGCTSLTTAPELPATTLADSCYYGMFSGCTSLTTAPELPATTLTNSCYTVMFSGCSNLNYIKAMFTTKPSIPYTTNWVSGVASTGTFVKNSAATWNVTGNHGVPYGWTVQTASA